MFVNHGWEPDRVVVLSLQTKALMIQMALKEIRARRKK